LEKRVQSASTIQQKFRSFIKRKNVVSLAKKSKSFYSIYPSFLVKPNMKHKNDVKIKIFKDLNSPNKFTIQPVKFCPVRNCHAFDIPKNKIHSDNKLMNFIFLSHNSKMVIDPNYKIIKLGDEYVNQINFKKFENNENNSNYLNLSFEEKESSNNNSDSFSVSEDNEENSESGKDENIGIKNCLTFSIMNKNKCNNSKIDLLSNANSTKDSIRMNSPAHRKIKRKRTKSILKNKNGSKSIPKQSRNQRFKKRVSFGSSQISFYKCQIK
jgi:hypothetical protein